MSALPNYLSTYRKGAVCIPQLPRKIRSGEKDVSGVANSAKHHLTHQGGPPRSFRRFVRKVFASLIKRQSCDGKHEIHTVVLDKLQDIADSIEIIAREMARQSKINESGMKVEKQAKI